VKNRRIDCHAHVLPDAYLDSLEGRVPIAAAPLYALEEVMERFEIDAAVISVGPPGAQTPRVARLANEAIAEIVRAAPERYAGLALLPLPDLDAALDELTYALDSLCLDGVMLMSSTAGIYVGDARLDQLFIELNRRGAYVLVHPWLPPYRPPLEHPPWLYELPFETMRAIASLVYSGALERFSSLRLQVPHLGGAAPFLAYRLASLVDREPQFAEAAPAGAIDYLGRLYYDTALAANTPALAATLAVTSLDHVVFGTDWPYVVLPGEGGDPAPGLATLLVEERARVDHVTAGTLVQRWEEA
jgi:predicted TIM-barrel fold metal-dependent hydrolase